ncbi:MAG TPA: phosphoribosylformylglycinamidine cyclo-ligase [Candidatus Scatomorpha intestinigallinarum]|uniref:Phosphoribosylformylglycinamidine cyclo-ligase n=1 Tax=Candidatus Scatomorpha intestinigallinarum TaxID=2840923 RepID=A0A9D1DLH8_9FIRM|nr:phosphoribosylformylglycinamidine cyclo-ligase [Candidatus Scatomorpha intestinigallinarum]
MRSESASYKAAGVDITAGYRAVELMKKHVQRTERPGVLGGLGGFGGLFLPNLAGMKEPVLVSGTDGVGTKLKIAFLLGKHDTVGIDCVAMCVNDIVCSGAEPLFFLDYIACGRNVPERIAEIVAGVAEGCVQAGAALIGGETAEMPGFYPEDEYDLAGFAVGLVDRERILDSSAMREGDALIALPSSGVHSNGFSLVRRVFEVEGGALERYEPELGRTLGEALLEPTRIYVKPVLALLRSARVSAISHITGGGFYENVPRALAPGFTARIEKAKLKTPPLFSLIARAGEIPERDMYNTFNMGVGMLAAVAAEDADAAVRCLRENGVEAYVCGEVERGEGGVELW